MSVAAVEVLVAGSVQGVGYRAFAQRRALALGLTGYALNLPDGRVMVRVEGGRDAIERLLAELAQGPPLARVTGTSVSSLPYTGRYTEFGVRLAQP